MKITLPEAPATNRYYRKWQGRMVVGPVGRAYKAEVSTLCHLAARQTEHLPYPLPRPLAVRIEWHRGRRSGDLDGRLKVLLDAMQGSVYENDSQIVELHAYRYDDKANPRMVVTVEAA